MADFYLPDYRFRAPLTVNPDYVGTGGVSNFQLLPPMHIPDDMAEETAFGGCFDSAAHTVRTTGGRDPLQGAARRTQ